MFFNVYTHPEKVNIFSVNPIPDKSSRLYKLKLKLKLNCISSASAPSWTLQRIKKGEFKTFQSAIPF